MGPGDRDARRDVGASCRPPRRSGGEGRTGGGYHRRLCVDERGAINVVDGVKRGGPADFYKMATESTNTLVIPTK